MREEIKRFVIGIGLLVLLDACGGTPVVDTPDAESDTSGINLMEGGKTVLSAENYVDYASLYYVNENSAQGRELSIEENKYLQPGKVPKRTNLKIERLSLEQEDKNIQIAVEENRNVTVTLFENDQEIAQTKESYQKFIHRIKR